MRVGESDKSIFIKPYVPAIVPLVILLHQQLAQLVQLVIFLKRDLVVKHPKNYLSPPTLLNKHSKILKIGL